MLIDCQLRPPIRLARRLKPPYLRVTLGICADYTMLFAQMIGVSTTQDYLYTSYIRELKIELAFWLMAYLAAGNTMQRPMRRQPGYSLRSPLKNILITLMDSRG